MSNPRPTSFGLVAGLLSAALLGFGSSALATTFTLELVDAGGITDVGVHSSVAVDAQGNPRISHHDATAFELEYAEKNGGLWSHEVVDTDGNVGDYTSLALDAQGNPHISYYDESNGNLKYARRIGGIWTIEIADSTGDVGLDTSIELDAQGNPRISYLSATPSFFDGDLKYAAKNGGIWSVVTVDSIGGVGEFTSLELDALGNPRISYHARGTGNLKYAARDASGFWNIEIADTQGGLYTTSLGLDASGIPHISYYDPANGDLRYAVKNGGIWSRATVDSLGNVGTNTSLVIDTQGNPRIAYLLDAPSNDLKYAVKSGGTWMLEVVDDQRGWQPSLALDAQGNPHISYWAASGGNLRYATGAPSGTGVSDAVTVPALQASMPWPNPASTNGTLSMHVDIPRSENIALELFDITGRRIAATPGVQRQAGPQVISWTPPQTAPGVYLVRLQTSSGLSVQRRWTRMK